MVGTEKDQPKRLEIEKNSPERHEISFVGKRHNPLAILLRHREQEPQHVHHTLPEFALESVEEEVRVLFRDGRGGVGGDVVSKDNVVKGEVDGGSVGEVGDDESIWRRREGKGGKRG